MSENKRLKILVELMHGMGDTVCAIPMLAVLRRHFPQAELTVLTKFPLENDILEASRVPIDVIRSFNIYQSLTGSIVYLKALRDYRFDYGISSCITPVRKANLFMKIVRPQHVIGLQNKGVFFDSLDDKYHFVEANLHSITDICNIPAQPIQPRIYSDERCLTDIRNRIGSENLKRKIVGICIGNADYSLKNRFLRTGKVYTRAWGIENMTKLIEALLQEDVTIALIGGKGELPLLDYVKEHVPANERMVDFVGKTSIKESIALASLCDCVFGVDTGMQHIADAVGAKTVSVFGPTNPHTHGAYSKRAVFLMHQGECPHQFCYGTPYYTNCPQKRACLSAISPIEAFEAVMQQIAE